MKKLALAASAVMAVAVACASSAEAKVKLGLYDAGAVQQICLVKGGTWYSPSLSGWAGKWFFENYPGDRLDLVGNSGSGTQNDAMTVNGTVLIWSEWSDSLDFVNHLHSTFTYLGKSCKAPLPPNTVNKTKYPAGG